MKKLLTSGLLLLATGASAFGFASCNFLDALGYVNDALSDDSGFIFALTDDQTSYAVTDYVGESEHVVIPDVYNQLPVTQIAGWAFNASETIKSIVIPESITQIGECECHKVEITQYADFSDWLLPFSHVHLSSLHVFS